MMLRNWKTGLCALAMAAGTALAQPEAPLSTSFTYQGQLKNGGSVISGTADFRFTLYDAAAGGVVVSGPVTVLNVQVNNGLFTTPIDFGVTPFNGDNRYLSIEVRSPAGAGAYSTISGRQLLSAAPYALQTRGLFTDGALNVGVGGTPTSKLDVFGDATVRGRVLVSSGTTPVLTTGMNNAVDKRMWLSHSTNFPNWGIQYRDFFSDGFPSDSIEFVAGDQTRPRVGIALSSGTMTFYDGTGSPVNNAVVVNTSSDGGLFDLYNAAGIRTINIDGSFNASFPGGTMTLYNRNATAGIEMIADGGGLGGSAGSPSSGMQIKSSGTRYVQLATNSTAGGFIDVCNSSGTTKTALLGNIGATGSGGAQFFQNNGTIGVDIRGSESTTTGGQINLYRADGVATISIDADFNGFGRIVTQEIQITGGADLSEQFTVTSGAGEIQPGMLVSIDPKNPGSLVVSGKAYDKTIAGVISGAGGVKPGMYMGQKGTAADGAHAVALTGRVYCYVDASENAVEPGDMLTTSDTAGYAMKAVDHDRAQGAVIGKAMTSLGKGEKGLVLVLVNLQ